MKRILLAAVVASTAFVATAANAEAVLFASYTQPVNSGRSMQYVNNSGSTAGGVFSTIGQQLVNFSYNDQTGLPASLSGTMSAYFNMTATSSSSAWCSNGAMNVCSGAGLKWQQIFETGTMSFTLPQSAGVGMAPGTNLVTISFQNMVLSGRGSSGGAEDSWDITVNNGSVLNFSSDFYDFSGLSASDFSLTLSGSSPAIGLASNNHSLNSFQAFSVGNISTDPLPVYVPEPGMLGLFGAGAIGLMVSRRRKK